MPYISTRDGSAPPERLPFEAALLHGLAHDGGLYVPEHWPHLSGGGLAALAGNTYAEIAAAVTEPFLEGAVAPAEWRRMVEQAYRPFTHRAVAPLKQLGPSLWLMELFHGPTLAFKDYALQLLGPLLDAVLKRRGERVTVVAATSGDTGSAAIEACRDRPSIDVFVLFPKGRISEVQRRQMTTVPAENVHAVAIEGNFDDCQDLVKAMFADAPFRAALNLSAVNSINWARIVAQAVYYVAAAAALGASERGIGFAVPTGNFGNVYAAHVARRMGVPIKELVIGTNRNDILARFFNSGLMSIGPVEPSLSPAMDIQVSSNFERLYFELSGRDGAAVANAFRAFRESGTLPSNPALWQEARTLFSAHRVSDDDTRATIAATYRGTGELIDPHTAVAVASAMAARRDPALPMVALACAHPAKFPDAVESAVGFRPTPPPALAEALRRPERSNVLPNELAAVERFVADRARAKQEAMR
ncbi:MAG TPA: threonine synthase [Stellaceae bacterium]|nr:threonine synthase [Stellaceae bacterium]